MEALQFSCETPYNIMDQWSLKLADMERAAAELLVSAHLFEVLLFC